ncbi:hypothetical protein [Halobacteriaceae bacterium SHR40]|uniref:hypothetical protein n=1 Tax=Halovenus amylolytica TaxID=2500550 RepID=UPI000FE35F21
MKRLVGTALFFIFALALVSRPLLSNLAILGQFGDTTDWQTLVLAALLVGPALLLVLARLGSLRSDDETHSDRTLPQGEWNADPRATQSRTPGEDRATPDDAENSEPDIREDDQETPTVPGFLSGQGGARDREFEIEEQPPDAELSDHLEHLRAELDDPESRRNLDRLEAVVAEHEDDTAIPDRCPQDHCDAAWSERGIIGARTGRYERLDEERVVCLACEQIYSPE